MSTYSALGPVTDAVYAALNVAGMTALVGARIYTDVPQAVSFPFVWFEVQETFHGGLGTRPGSAGAAWEMPFRVHVFSTYAGWKEAQPILAKAVELLAVPLSPVGLSMHAVFHDDAVPLPDEIVNGVKCRELVQNGRFYVEAA